MKNILKKIFLLTILILSLESKEIKIGMSADFSGPIDYLGNSMKTGIQTYLNVINKTSENKYKLITLDDKYNPISASKNVRKLINEEKVVAFLGNLGTPTANVTVPIVNENKIVSFGAYSG
ncbi:ABC transporter substrate-binding protein, partial [Poseidonibacter sp.]